MLIHTGIPVWISVDEQGVFLGQIWPEDSDRHGNVHYVAKPPGEPCSAWYDTYFTTTGEAETWLRQKQEMRKS